MHSLAPFHRRLFPWMLLKSRRPSPDLEARLIATPVNKDHQDEIVGDLLAAVQS